MKHTFKPGQWVSYNKKDHQYKRQHYINGRVVRVSRKRVVIRDPLGRLHYVKPINLSSLIYK